MLPQKSFMTKDCLLYESDFDVTTCVKLQRIMELMQDIATTHADKLGCGWDDCILIYCFECIVLDIV